MDYIYRVTIGNKHYWGSTSKIDRRRKAHLRSLKQNYHVNNYMQNAFNKYQEYKFEVIYEVSPDENRWEVEQKFIDDHIGKPYCMNLNPIASKPPVSKKGMKKPNARGPRPLRRGKANGRSKPIIVIFTDGTEKYFESMGEASRQLKISDSALSHWVLKERTPRKKFNIKEVNYANI